jgi:choline dehydrogenase-like flavoprotein
MEAPCASSSAVVVGSGFGGSVTAYRLAETPRVEDEVGIPLG